MRRFLLFAVCFVAGCSIAMAAPPSMAAITTAAPPTTQAQKSDAEKARALDLTAVDYKHAQKDCEKEQGAARDACMARVKCYHDTAVDGIKSGKGPNPALCLDKIQPPKPPGK